MMTHTNESLLALHTTMDPVAQTLEAAAEVLATARMDSVVEEYPPRVMEALDDLTVRAQHLATETRALVETLDSLTD